MQGYHLTQLQQLYDYVLWGILPCGIWMPFYHCFQVSVHTIIVLRLVVVKDNQAVKDSYLK